MAITIQASPTNNASVSNEMLFTVYESVKAIDPVTYPDYRYVCDVYVDAVLVDRIKVRPDPTYNIGVFDVSRILQSFFTSGLKANYASATESYTIHKEYQLKFGEEYADTLYTNLLVDSARECYSSYEVRPFDNSDVMPDVDNDFATSAPNTIYSSKDIKWHLLPFWDNVSGISDFSYKFYDSSGVQVGSTGTISAAGYVAKSILQLNVGFVKLAAASSLTTQQQASVDYLEVYGNGETQTIRYRCSKYPVKVLAWLNKFGAYESYHFGMVSMKQTEISRKEYEKLPYTWNASGEVSYSSNGVFYGGKRGFASDMKTSLKITSDLLNDNEYAWLSELVHSPDVYLYDSTLDKFFPVSIQANQYEYRTYLNSRLKPLELTVNYSDMFNAQRL